MKRVYATLALIGIVCMMMVFPTAIHAQQRTYFKNENSGKCLDVNNNSSSNGAKIQQWDCNGSWAQQWDIVYAGSGPSVNGNPGNYYYLKKAGTNKCLDVAGAALWNGTRIHLWDCHGGTNQRWLLYNHFWSTGAKVSLVNQNSQKCMDVPSFSRTNGTEIVQWTCGFSWRSTNQNWFWNGQ